MNTIKSTAFGIFLLVAMFGPAFLGGALLSWSVPISLVIAACSPAFFLAVGVAGRSAEGRGSMGPYR
jgi:hypothetical protein